MRPFDRFKRRLHASVDGMYAERVLIVAWNQGREDPERPRREIVAPLGNEDRETQSLSGDRSGDFDAQIRVGGAVLKPSPDTYPDLDIRKGDTVTALDRPGQPKWRVSAVDPAHNGRLLVYLGDT